MEFELWPLFAYNHRVPEAVQPPVNAATRYCAVLGHPIRHSASPAMQNAALAALGLDWRYLAFDVHPDNLRAAISGAKVMKFIGLNLTVPHKLLAVSMVDVIDESAKTWGAVNTIRFEARDTHGHWQSVAHVAEESHGAWRTVGFNTDADAIARSLGEDLGCRVAGARVLLLGTGGAGHTAALRLAAEGAAELFLVNRTQAKADELAREIQKRYPKVTVIVGYPKAGVDLLLNATSLGLKAEDPLPLDAAHFSLNQAGAVYDMIYRPAETPLLRAARAAGCRTANGLGMLLYQGAKALEIWTGQPAPLAVMRRALEQNVYGH
jgi:shikimate dehydrogenase